jgi:ATP-dependent DNA helicase RecQ
VRASAPGAAADHDPELFDRLRRRRKELADAAGVPPYVVFSDRTLVEMAARLPTDLDDLLAIHGVGEVKAERYAAPFLELILAYREEKGLPPPERRRSAPAAPPPPGPRRFEEVGRAYNAGESAADLAARYGVKLDTILEHLAGYSASGRALRDPEGLTSASTLDETARLAVMEAFDELGTLHLKPVHDRFAGAVSYTELKLVRLLREGVFQTPSATTPPA